MLKIYNTMTAGKEAFQPLVPGLVRMYVCGVTVYDECHLGHARSALVFEVIRWYLEASGYAVTFVKNFTDVDDKIIRRAREQDVPWQAIASRYIEAYHRDMRRLNIHPATVEPKVTEHMADIIALIDTLVQRGIAYQAGPDVYFQVEKFPDYGLLSKRRLEDMQAGARVEVDEQKRHPMDFVLWKGAKPGEPFWDSPWGPGRPGWHIECSAMSMRHLGETFDIHGGGADLIFPHHENEIAQSSAATGKEFARHWVHNGFVQINQEKMAKSLGNFFTIREIFEHYGDHEDVTGEVLRYFLLATHYRNPLDFSDAALQEAKKALDGFYGLFQRLEESRAREGGSDELWHAAAQRLESSFQQAMDDDFNTPAAIAELQKFRGEVNRLLEISLSRSTCQDTLATFRRFGRILGLFHLKDWRFARLGDGPMIQPQQTFPTTETIQQPLGDEEIERHLMERNEARRRKDFARADTIRASLSAQGITIEDRPDGTSRWKR